MIILALDTALDCCSVALYNSETEQVLARISEPMAKGHAERLIPFIEQVFEEAGLEPNAIDKIVVTRGPGSFTGLRVALSAARAFALAIDKPCVGISTLDLLMFGQKCAIAVIDARHESCFAQIIINDQVILLAALYKNEFLQSFIAEHNPVILGNGAHYFGAQYDQPLSIENLCKMGVNASVENHPVTPLYLKATDVTPQIKGHIALKTP